MLATAHGYIGWLARFQQAIDRQDQVFRLRYWHVTISTYARSSYRILSRSFKPFTKARYRHISAILKAHDLSQRTRGGLNWCFTDRSWPILWD